MNDKQFSSEIHPIILSIGSNFRFSLDLSSLLNAKVSRLMFHPTRIKTLRLSPIAQSAVFFLCICFSVPVCIGAATPLFV